jgi:hypothetical protein
MAVKFFGELRKTPSVTAKTNNAIDLRAYQISENWLSPGIFSRLFFLFLLYLPQMAAGPPRSL